ncbi:hypothetical protein HBI56_194780 [Parastagonospora nodorum]|nr:hypothetical protein HBH56_206450 [Parastagonospora nodorum]KAH3923749.1 hypothetical protein HBH54_205320 [Parastagonospora nodorum]KAH3962345.1 hypothetical protein HBH51_176740 [Parastagonospora nodorum]KAH3967205.1 hypothetical protein HBH52_191110 [Parastagonospora nodorum]KAH3993101.1 hypothetical protein HBI10_208180 [Parastagonospora nodorum]
MTRQIGFRLPYIRISSWLGTSLFPRGSPCMARYQCCTRQRQIRQLFMGRQSGPGGLRGTETLSSGPNRLPKRGTPRVETTTHLRIQESMCRIIF